MEVHEQFHLMHFVHLIQHTQSGDDNGSMLILLFIHPFLHVHADDFV